MTKWDNLWARPSTMLAMGVEVRPSGWLEEVEKEGYLMQEKLEAIRRIVSLEYVSNVSQVDRILEVLGDG